MGNNLKGTSTTPDNPGNSPIMHWIKANIGYRGDDCLIWPFGTRGGYGQFGRGRKQYAAHRYICELVNGPPPEGYHAAHSCGNGHGGCVNPRHLSWKTPSENQLDRKDKNRRRTKLTTAAANAIRALAGKETPTDIARRYGITEAAVRLIWYGKTWNGTSSRRRDLSPEQVLKIRAIGFSRTAREIAQEVGCGESVVYRVRSGKFYRHVHAIEN